MMYRDNMCIRILVLYYHTSMYIGSNRLLNTLTAKPLMMPGYHPYAVEVCDTMYPSCSLVRSEVKTGSDSRREIMRMMAATLAERTSAYSIKRTV